MMVVVAVPPGVVGVVLINAQNFADQNIHTHRGEEVAVGQIVELHEDSKGISPSDEPSEIPKAERD
jgi:hypothetical protein